MANGKNRHYCSVTWRIYNYLNAPVDLDETLESPEFITNFNEPIKWKLGIIRSGKTFCERIIKFTVKRSYPRVKLQITGATTRFEVVSSSGRRYISEKIKMSFSEHCGTICGFSGMYRDMCFNYIPNSDLPTVTITCYFLHDDPFDTSIDVHLRPLLDDLKTLFDCEKFRDLKLKVGSQIFPVHRAIVIARSSYVARILNENPKLREIDLTKKCSESQLKGLIKYWYTGDIEELPRTLSPSTLNFLLNMQEVGLLRYIDPEVIEMSTTFKEHVKYFSWPLKEDNSVVCRNIKNLDKTEYRFGTDKKELRLYPKGESGNEDSVLLKVQILWDETLVLCIDVFLMDKDNAEHNCQRRVIYHKHHGDMKYAIWLTLSDFVEFIKFREKLLEDDKLMVRCRVIWRYDYEENARENCISSALCSDISTLLNDNPYTILANDMKKLLESEDSSDISLRIGNKTFNVHKAILAARSPYFKKLFCDKEFKIPESREILINGVDSDDLSSVLKHMYQAEIIGLQKNRVMSVIRNFCK